MTKCSVTCTAMTTPDQKLGRCAKSRAGSEAIRRQADARAFELAPIVAGLWASGVTSCYGIEMELNKRGIPTASRRGVWRATWVRLVMERLK
jgi:hypothetical protein